MTLVFNQSAANQKVVFTSVASVTLPHPFCVGAWVNDTSTGGTTRGNFMSIIDTAGAYYAFGGSGANATIGPNSTSSAVASSAYVSGQWAFYFARLLSTASRNLNVWETSTNTFINGSNTIVYTPTAVARITYGTNDTATPVNFWGGSLGPNWIALGDIAGGLAANVPASEIVRHLALYGPWNMFNDNVLYYNSMRNPLDPEWPFPGTGHGVVSGAPVMGPDAPFASALPPPVDFNKVTII